MRTLIVLALFIATLSRANAACACSTPCACTPACACAPAAGADTSAPAKPAAAEPAPVGHLLKGVVVEILAAKSALLVKHEEIPGVMKAMTMLLKVDAATLAAAKKNQAITATLVKKTDGWWLENVSAQ